MWRTSKVVNMLKSEEKGHFLFIFQRATPEGKNFAVFGTCVGKLSPGRINFSRVNPVLRKANWQNIPNPWDLLGKRTLSELSTANLFKNGPNLNKWKCNIKWSLPDPETSGTKPAANVFVGRRCNVREIRVAHKKNHTSESRTFQTSSPCWSSVFMHIAPNMNLMPTTTYCA